MLNIKKIPVVSLNNLLEEERGGVSDDEFVERYTQGAIKSLLSEPLLYRSYGAYWWPLKRLILASPSYRNEFGDSYDEVLNTTLSYDSDAITVCAAFLEQEDNVANGYMKANSFNYEGNDGDTVEITVEDEVMEKLAFLLSK